MFTRSRPAPVALRLETRPGEVIDRTQSFSFSWNGRSYTAYAGDSIVSALVAGGVRVFSRSLKYHRPRGVLTATAHDPNCLVQVGQEPNVRAAHRRATPGMVVAAQNAWPTLRLDAKAANQALGRFIGPGFYYKTFIKPRALWPAYEAVLRRFAAGGRLPTKDEVAEEYFDKRYAHVDVLVAGGGPAGMAAAAAAASAGARVMLVEEEHALGGHLRFGGPAELDARRRLDERAAAEAGVEVLLEELEGFGVDDRGDDRLERLPDDPADPGLLPAPGDRQHLVAGPLHPRLVGAPEAVDRLVVGALEQRRAGQQPLAVERPAEGQDRALGDHGLVEIEEGGLHRDPSA